MAVDAHVRIWVEDTRRPRLAQSDQRVNCRTSDGAPQNSRNDSHSCLLQFASDVRNEKFCLPPNFCAMLEMTTLDAAPDGRFASYFRHEKFLHHSCCSYKFAT